VTSNDFDNQINSVAALGEPVRRELYRYVAAQAEPVSRENAAAGVGVPHHVAKFHLDKLEEDGLLDAEYRRPAGRTGPGAGRPAKLYRRSARHIAVSLPERRYDLAGRILADAVSTARSAGLPVDDMVTETARLAGHTLGEQARQVDPESADPADPLDAACRVLAANGYEPRVSAGRVTLANCPFDDLARRDPALVCGLNLGLIGGLLDALATPDLCATLDPAPGRCCVTVGPQPAR
jgi:predicted ArsR family transcriptional regulator